MMKKFGSQAARGAVLSSTATAVFSFAKVNTIALPRSLTVLRCRGHVLAQAERPHVGPHRLDVFEAFGLRSALAAVAPSERILAIGRPDRVLLFVVHHDLVDSRVFPFVSRHTACVSSMASAHRMRSVSSKCRQVTARGPSVTSAAA